MRTHWRIIKTDRPRNRWALERKHHMPDGYVSEWKALSYYPSRKAAINVGLIMRDRGEPIAWQGGAIRMGIATVESGAWEG